MDVYVSRIALPGTLLVGYAALISTALAIYLSSDSWTMAKNRCLIVVPMLLSSAGLYLIDFLKPRQMEILLWVYLLVLSSFALANTIIPLIHYCLAKLCGFPVCEGTRAHVGVCLLIVGAMFCALNYELYTTLGLFCLSFQILHLIKKRFDTAQRQKSQVGRLTVEKELSNQELHNLQKAMQANEKAAEQKVQQLEEEMKKERAASALQIQIEWDKVDAERSQIEKDRNRLEQEIISMSTYEIAQGSWVKLNVGGKKFETTAATLSKCYFFQVMLSGRFRVQKDSDGDIIIRIDRNGKWFETILDYFRTGQIELPDDRNSRGDAIRALMHEVDFYGIEDLKKALSKMEEDD
jgi:hypothetical protein